MPIRASIGITLGEPEDTTQELLRRADVAMYQAKRAGTHGWTLHDPSMTDRRAEDAALTEDLANALGHDELYVLYQPIVDLTDGHPIALEALLRWQHPTRGVVSPVQFIPIAERSGAIAAIGLLGARTGLRATAHLAPRPARRPAAAHQRQPVARGSCRNPPWCRTSWPSCGAPASTRRNLVLEVTESAVVDQPAIAVAGRPARPRHPDRHRRLRHRVLVAALPDPAPGGHPEDRPQLRRPS